MGDYYYSLVRGLSFKILLTPRFSVRLPGSEYTGESILKSNNSTNILSNLKLLLTVSVGTRRSGLRQKTRHKKSHDTITLNGIRLINLKKDNDRSGEKYVKGTVQRKLTGVESGIHQRDFLSH